MISSRKSAVLRAVAGGLLFLLIALSVLVIWSANHPVTIHCHNDSSQEYELSQERATGEILTQRKVKPHSSLRLQIHSAHGGQLYLRREGLEKSLLDQHGENDGLRGTIYLLIDTNGTSILFKRLKPGLF